MDHSPGFLALVDEARKSVRTTDVEGYRRILEDGEPHLLVDIREESEWAAGHAAGAVHLGKGVIERDIEKTAPDKNTRMVLYCGGGFRSVLAAEALQKMGYTNVVSLDGGWRQWKEAGMPIEKL